MSKTTLGIVFIVAGGLLTLLGLFLFRLHKPTYSDTDWNSQTSLNLIISGIVITLGGIAALRFA